VNGSIDREGVHGIINAFDLERARLLVLDRPDFYLQWNEQKKHQDQADHGAHPHHIGIDLKWESVMVGQHKCIYCVTSLYFILCWYLWLADYHGAGKAHSSAASGSVFNWGYLFYTTRTKTRL